MRRSQRFLAMVGPRDASPAQGPAGAANAALVNLDDVGFGYDTSPVLSDVSLSISAGEFYGVVGPSGAGKTTLLRLILGTVRPRRGTLTRRPGTRVGYVPQLETVNWNFPVTVSECVLMARPNRMVPWPSRSERAAVHDVLDRLGLDGLQNRHIRELSGGQQQRMFIARALLAEPDLLLLDEPTSGVDMASRHDMLHLLADLNAEGVTIVVTTHDLNGVAAHLPTLIAVRGTVIAAGTPAEVITPAVLEKTYGAPVEVLQHMGMPVVLERGWEHLGSKGA